MIELTNEQSQAMEAGPQPPVAIDPRTGQEYLLLRREIYELVKGTLKPFSQGWEDDPEMDAYEQFRNHGFVDDTLKSRT
jgi:hypothetical protein